MKFVIAAAWALLIPPENAGAQSENLPDLVIEDAYFQVRLIEPPPPVPGKPRRGSDSFIRKDYQFVLLVLNDGSAVFAEQFQISWKEVTPEDRPFLLEGRSAVNSVRTILLPGESMWVPVRAHRDLKAGAIVRFRIEPPYRDGYLSRYEEERYDNNEYEWVVVREE